MGLVVLMGFACLVLGTLMLSTSGNFLRGNADARSKLRARYAAEGMVAVQLARMDYFKDSLLGGDFQMPSVGMTGLNTGNGEQADADIDKIPNPHGIETITSGQFRGMKGLRAPFLIQATGVAASEAKSKVSVEAYVYQVPIFQFGVFYQGDLEIMPGLNMSVLGPTHANGNILLRGMNGVTLSLQGPVTSAKTIWQWVLGTGQVTHRTEPNNATPWVVPGLTSTITAMTDATRPPAVYGVWNVQQGVDPLTLPLGGFTPHELLERCRGDEAPALRRQKFDCLPGVVRYYEGTTTPPAYLSDPKVFFDRREDRWVWFRDFDVAAAQAALPHDSIFYLSNKELVLDKGSAGIQAIDAFRLVNASHLVRNFTIATHNPIYVLGDFNVGYAGGPCHPANPSGPVPDAQKYCNTLIASDALTALSVDWTARKWDATKADSTNMKGTLEQPASNATWTKTRKWVCDPTPCAPVPTLNASGVQVTSRGYNVFHYPVPGTDAGYVQHNDNVEFKNGVSGDAYYTPTALRINAAVMTGNKPTRSGALPPAITDNNAYESIYEGGWHNTIRFLEHWSSSSVTFCGSFICLWAANTPGLNTDQNVKVLQTTGWSNQTSGNSLAWPAPATVVLPYQAGTGYYIAPSRIWGYDDRFRDIANMPPGTPFLSTGIYTNWADPSR
jgi:hypothetical protein